MPLLTRPLVICCPSLSFLLSVAFWVRWLGGSFAILALWVGLCELQMCHQKQ